MKRNIRWIAMNLTLNLLVLRCHDIEATRRFYEKLGFAFTTEKHGAGPEHFASANAHFVLELYPLAQGQTPEPLRIGFSVPFLAELSGDLRHDDDVTILKQPYTANRRVILLVQDPDGRKVEISQELYG